MALTDDVRELFAGPNYAHLATLLPDGSPHSVAIWAGVEGDRIAFFTQTKSRKARNLALDSRVAVSVTDHENPYRSAWLRGRVTATVEGDEALAIIDRLSRKYTDADFPMRSGIVFLIEPERSGAVALPFRHEPA